MKDNRFSDSFENADAAFSGLYSAELKQLKGLSKEDVNAIIPSSDSSEIYQSLIDIIDKASKENLMQAQLISNIKGLGNLAVKLAKTIPTFEKFL